jgi:hypothetical protein
MKKLLTFAVALFVFLFTSCSEDIEGTEDDYLSETGRDGNTCTESDYGHCS